MTRLILLIGIPGSGKSSLARQLVVQSQEYILVSTDAIRAQLFGNEAIQGPWLLIWRELECQLRQALKAISQQLARVAIYDATNASGRQRQEAIALCRTIGYTHITGLWLDPPIWLCLARNRRRQRQVPEEVILRMHRQLRDTPPTLADGLDRLIRETKISTKD
jgi:predicted kinase